MRESARGPGLKVIQQVWFGQLHVKWLERLPCGNETAGLVLLGCQHLFFHLSLFSPLSLESILFHPHPSHCLAETLHCLLPPDSALVLTDFPSSSLILFNPSSSIPLNFLSYFIDAHNFAFQITDSVFI